MNLIEFTIWGQDLLLLIVAHYNKNLYNREKNKRDKYKKRRERKSQKLGLTVAACGSNDEISNNPMADYRRLSCPSCGRRYKYRGGLLRHIAECFSEAEKVEVLNIQHQQQQQLTAKDVRVLYKFWKP
ncbi:hypothetical protein TSAR_012265 [Trichomalopsis sarcophagae]|uniref:C2H2-type domain-containing protein n=1 Tax=Trichomalopsis sarcophagae TaxID=543379 RepID=A0A232FN21_9HYME|nr:hypothetical protein TSAR_012265 [Trichomalopsis sarcophagae]